MRAYVFSRYLLVRIKHKKSAGWTDTLLLYWIVPIPDDITRYP